MKQRLILDIDDTVWNSSEVIISMLNKKYNLDKTINDLKDYGYKSIYKNITNQEIYEMFSSDYFYENVKFKLNFIEFCNKFNSKFSFEFLTRVSDLISAKKKYEWFNQNFIYNFGFYAIDKKDTKKQDFDLNGSIFIDDMVDNIIDSNAKIKIIIKNYIDTAYNKAPHGSEIYEVNDWKDIIEFMNFNIANSEIREV